MHERVKGDKAIIGFIVWVTVAFSAAAFGGLFRPGAWYAELARPSWTPPSWLFGPVWTVLYFMMGASAWLVWRKGGFRAQALPLRIFLVQLLLNAAWSAIFFGMHKLLLSSIEILLLWAAILATILVFRPVSRLAAWLLVPYLAWVTYASALNITIWRLNPGI